MKFRNGYKIKRCFIACYLGSKNVYISIKCKFILMIIQQPGASVSGRRNEKMVNLYAFQQGVTVKGEAEVR